MTSNSDRRRPQDIEAIAGITPLQQGILFYSRSAGEQDPYYCQSVFALSGAVDVDALTRAWQSVIDRHPVLRADYRWDESSAPVQLVFKTRRFGLDLIDWRAADEPEQLRRLRNLLEEERKAGYDFRHAADIRVRLIRTSDEASWLTWSPHHIALDGWSVALVLSEVLRIYQADLQGEAVELDTADRYLQYVKWLLEQDKSSSARYWKQALTGFAGPTPLPNSVVLDRTGYAEHKFEFSEEESRALEAGATQLGVTLNALFQAAWAVLLGRHADAPEVTFGVTVSGRSASFGELETTAGMFVNTLPLRVKLTPEMRVGAWVRELQKLNAEVREHECYPLVEVRRALSDSGDRALFESVVVFGNYPIDDVLRARSSEGLRVERLGAEHLRSGDSLNGRNNYPLSLIVDPGVRLRVTLAYHRRAYEDHAVDELAAHVVHLLRELSRSGQSRLASIGLPLVRTQHTVPDLEQGSMPSSVVDMFLEHARAEPGRVALQRDGVTLSYGELNAAASALAAELGRRGIGPEDRVALDAERSLEFCVGLLAVLQAGAVYVPVDANLPGARRLEIVHDSASQLILARGERVSAFSGASVPTLQVKIPSAAAGSVAFEPVPVHAGQAAYVIYTSGSTGRPKGVLVGHGALSSYVHGVLERLKLEPTAELVLMSTAAADLGHTVLFGALCSGRVLHLISETRAFDPDAFVEYVLERDGLVLKVVPSHLRALLQAGDQSWLLRVQTLVMGGEKFDWELCELLAQLAPRARLFNHYGPTETTVGASTFEVGRRRIDSKSVPIGRPLPGVQLRILDRYQNPVPSGVSGELYIGGPGLARGYLAQPGLTAERFVPSADGAGARLYRTGDRVRQLGDGSVEFLGRTDEQVKVRGYRVEPGDVRAQLTRLDGVLDAAIVADEGPSGAELTAFVVLADTSGPAAPEQMREALSRVLPDYMLPREIVILPRLPLTPNGKLDRRLLPRPGERKGALEPAAPVGAIEQKLAAIWKEVLRLDRVGVTDRFLELGGDSIAGLQIVGRARKQGMRITPKQVFEQQTIRQLAQVLESEPPPTATTGGARVTDSELIDLTPIQRRFFELHVPERDHYNQAVLLDVRGPLASSDVEQALRQLVVHHAALRLRYQRGGNGEWCQRQATVEEVRKAWQVDPLVWVREARTSAEASEVYAAAQRSLKLDTGPTLRAALVSTEHGQQLMLAAHHLAIDAVSWRVLVEDLEHLCQQIAAKDAIELPGRSSSFGDWALRLRDYARSEDLAQELGFWLPNTPPSAPQELRRDNPNGTHLAGDAVTLALELDANRTQALRTQAYQAYRAQILDVLVSALARALCRWNSASSVLVELEGHGRADLFDDLDLSRTVGWFTSLFPVQLAPDKREGAEGSASTLKQIKEQLRSIPRGGLGYGVARYLAPSEVKARVAALPAARVTFNYLGQLDPASDSPGLLELAREGSAGPTQGKSSVLANWLVFNAYIRGGELTLGCTFSSDMYRTETIEALNAAIREELDAIVTHCERGGGVTPSDYPLARLDQNQLDSLSVDWRGVEDVYPLSPMQEGLLMHTLREPASGIYLMQHRYRIQNGVNVETFEAAWARALSRHQVLRASYRWDAGLPMLQVIHRNVGVPLEYADWRALEPAAREERIAQSLQDELVKGFDMSRPPLWRLRLSRLTDTEFELVISFHHILMDAWSRAALVAEVFATYQAASDGQVAVDSPVSQYRDFIAWLGGRDLDAAAQYWQRALGGFEFPTPLPADRHMPKQPGGATVGSALLELSRTETKTLERVARERQLTPNTLLQAAWALTLMKFSGHRDVVFGVTVAGRPVEREELQSAIGLFINTIPLRVCMPSARSTPVGEWVSALLEQNVAMRQHEFIPLVKIHGLSEIPRDQSLFHSLFVYENAPNDHAVNQRANQMGVVPLSSRTHTNYPITMVLNPGPVLGVELAYDDRLFEVATIDKILTEFRRFVLALLADAQVPVWRLLDVDAGERQKMLHDWNATQRAWPTERGFIGLLAEQVAQHPDRIAATCEAEHISLGQLSANAERIAGALHEHGVQLDEPVCVLTYRDLELLNAVVGVLVAGAAFVPLDPLHPVPRIADVLRESRARVVVTVQALLPTLTTVFASLGEGQRPAVVVADVARTIERPAPLPERRVHERGLAYVIYTSGSTGTPKGAMVEHAGMLNNQLSKVPYLGLKHGDVIAQTAAQSFDISIWQLLAGLSCGVRVEVVPDAIVRDPAELLQHIAATGISIIESVPSLIQTMLPLTQEAPPSLRVMIATGESLSPELARGWRRRYPGVTLVNAYGPAECADDVAMHRFEEAVPEEAICVPVGRPTDNNQLYILDDELELVPSGVVGEICAAGIGVGRGYLNRPGQTGNVFVPNPFASGLGQRLYRTGDLGRHRPDGSIECVGRRDQQVKIRGVRIELGEVESRLQQHSRVQTVVAVAADASSGKQLVAYVVPTGDMDLELASELKTYLARVLPEHMVPAKILMLESLPLLPNGKVNIKALASATPPSPTIVEGLDDVEALLARIWQDVLGVASVGANDNFFELGGDSIMTLQVVSRARQLGFKLAAKDMFERQTVRLLAACARPNEPAVVKADSVAGSVPLTPIQRWFFELPVTTRHHYNQAVLFKAKERLEPALVEKALCELVQQHDALRLRFEQQNGVWVQSYATSEQEHERWVGDPLSWVRRARGAAELVRIADEAQRSLRLDAGPLLRAVAIDLLDGTQRLLLVVHHLVVDGVSWRVLVEDLSTLYRQLRAGQPATLGAKSSSFQRWSEALVELARSEELEGEVARWQALLDPEGLTDLPRDEMTPEASVRTTAMERTKLDRVVTTHLVSGAPEAYRTRINELLLTALARVLCRWAGGSSVLVDVEGHGREERDGIDTSRTVGWFAALYPVRLSPGLVNGEGDMGSSIKAVKEQIRSLPGRGLGYGVLRYLADAKLAARIRSLPRARITFNYLGQLDQALGERALLELATEGVGESRAEPEILENWLVVNSHIHDGELAISWSYSPEMFRPATVARLAEAYRVELERLVKHCASPSASGLTPSDFPLAHLDQAQLDELGVTPRQVQDIYPLSSMQQGMLFHAIYEPGSSVYVNQLSASVEGLDGERLARSLETVVARHDVLRTSFVWRAQMREPLQIVHRTVPSAIEELDWRGRPAPVDEALRELEAAERSKGFEWSRPPLQRLLLVRLTDTRWRLIWSHHHVLMDGWSFSRVIDEMLTAYAGVSLPGAVGRYGQYIAWVRRQDPKLAEEFWKSELRRLDSPTLLVGSLPRGRGHGHALLRRELGVQRTLGLRRFAQRERVTLSVLMQAAVLLVLQGHTRQRTVALGCTVAGRADQLEGADATLGMFMNTLPLIETPSPRATVGAWLRALQDHNQAIREQAHAALYDIQRWGGRGAQPLFDTILVVDNYPADRALRERSGAVLKMEEIRTGGTTNYPLTLGVNIGESIAVKFHYKREDFDEAAVDALSTRLEAVLEQLVQSGDRLLSTVSMLPVGQAAVGSRVPSATMPPAFEAVYEKIEARAAEAPDAVALTREGQSLSYAALNAKANQLARRLRESGVGPDVLVGCAVERSFELIVVLLAIAKAGGAYVPLDLESPAGRVGYMLEDSGVTVVVTEERFLPVARKVGAQVFCVDRDWDQLERYDASNIGDRVHPDHLAYCIYTSGSTGRPKGVEMTHAGLSQRLDWMRAVYAIKPADIILHKTPLTFDVSVWELFVPLLSGARMVVAPPGAHRDPERIASLIVWHDVTIVHFVPAMLREFLASGAARRCETLEHVFSGGEALTVDLQKRLFEELPTVKLHNRYGPTETAIFVSHWDCVDDGAASIPIGFPVSGVELHVLDPLLRSVPAGVAGELYVGGEGIARGYHGRAQLTAERFVPSPLSSKGERLYATGDLARYRGDGAIEYLGRNDNQVKIRGLRVELGEIEAALLEHEAIGAAAVATRQTVRGVELLAYAVLVPEFVTRDRENAKQAIEKHLEEQLPSYMVPAHLMLLGALPLTSNGKLDRAALPEPDEVRGEYVEPEPGVERQVAKIWADVLGVDRVGRTDDFFQLGGHSLLATQAVSRIRQELRRAVSLRQLLESTSLEDFTASMMATESGVRHTGSEDREPALAAEEA